MSVPSPYGRVTRPALMSIEDTLRGNRRLGRSAAVQSSDSFDGPMTLSEDAWFVTADVVANPGLSTWLLSEEAYRTGGGIVVSVIIGVTPDADGFAASVACVGSP